MKFYKSISMVLAAAILCGTLAGCGGNNGSSGDSGTGTKTEGDNSNSGDILSMAGLDEDLRFTETRSITVEVFDRGNDGGSKPEDNFYTDFIKEGMLRDHNVEVTFQIVPRWTEVEELNNLLASGSAPDICLTYNMPTVRTYASMGGVLDLSEIVDDYKEILPNLWGLLGETNIYWNKHPENGSIYAVEALLHNRMRINTFVREDWLEKLNLSEPTTTAEFEEMLRAFKDNAELLLGSDADKMIPFSTSYDLSWRTNHLLTSYVPDDITDKNYYVHRFDERQFLQDGIKEGMRKLNEWYNEGLVWKDFPLYGAGDKTEDNLIKAGYVGAFMHNWDYPYRDGDEGIAANLKRMVGEDAAFIAIDPFENEAGVHKKFLAAPIDRKIFFPSTNEEPVASLLYLDWISKLENRIFLQIGEEGVTHEVQPDGAVKVIAAKGEKIMNSPSNIDYTMTLNGLDLGDDDLNIKSLALNYAGVDARYIEKAHEIALNDGRYDKQVNVGDIVAEEGLGPALQEKRDVALNNAAVAKPEQFDSVFDSAMQDYLNSGGQAIIDERIEKFEHYFGTDEMLPY